MRLIGWCERCHRVRRVQAHPAQLGRRGVVVGICDACSAPEPNRPTPR